MSEKPKPNGYVLTVRLDFQNKSVEKISEHEAVLSTWAGSIMTGAQIIDVYSNTNIRLSIAHTENFDGNIVELQKIVDSYSTVEAWLSDAADERRKGKV